MPPERDPGSAPRAWHLAPLAALAISHPLADVLVGGPEFFVAHRFDARALVWLGFWLFIALPAGLWLADISPPKTVAAFVTRLSTWWLGDEGPRCSRNCGASTWHKQRVFHTRTAQDVQSAQDNGNAGGTHQPAPLRWYNTEAR